MDDLDKSPGTDECVVCYGELRLATREEIEKRLRTASPQFRKAVRSSGGNWFTCCDCGTVVHWC
jgi:hypothetical protein